MQKYLKSPTGIVVAVLAIALLMTGSVAAAAPSDRSVSKKTIKKIAKQIAKKEIRKAAPGLSVNKANSATTAENAQALGGKSLAQIQPVLAGAQDSSNVADVGGGTDVVTLTYTLAAPSKVNLSGVAQLAGDNSTPSQASCQIRNDGASVSLNFETAFDDIGTSNPVSNAVLAHVANVAAGTHTATLRCTRAVGANPITKDDAAINIVAVPN